MTYQVGEDSFNVLKRFLEENHYKFEERPYQKFLAKKNGSVVNLYDNGKVVISGKDSEDKEKIIEFLTEMGANILVKKLKKYPPIEISGTRIGTDEVGKGDYFGPLVIAGTMVTEHQAEKLREMGIRDSKTLSDSTIQNYAVKIKRILITEQYEIITIAPIKYNLLYKKFKNLNGLLGWGHARAIENLLMFKEPCDQAIADQFGDQSYIENALMKRGRKIKLIQTPKAEREISVAAASILARSEFINQMRIMGETYSLDFPKGSSHVKEFSLQFIDDLGIEALCNVAKIHFKITDQLIENQFDEKVENMMNYDSVPVIYEEQDSANVQLECFNLICSFEKEFRKYIKRELEVFYKEDWWDKGIEEQIRKKVEKLQRSEVAKGKHMDLIDGLEFEHYRFIITDRNNWPKIFEKDFITKERFLAHFQILKDVRHPVAHSRSKFKQKDRMEVITNIRYFRGVFNQKSIKDFMDEN